MKSFYESFIYFSNLYTQGYKLRILRFREKQPDSGPQIRLWPTPKPPKNPLFKYYLSFYSRMTPIVMDYAVLNDPETTGYSVCEDAGMNTYMSFLAHKKNEKI